MFVTFECSAVVRFVASAMDGAPLRYGAWCYVSPVVAAASVIVRTHFVPICWECVVGAEIILSVGRTVRSIGITSSYTSSDRLAIGNKPSLLVITC